ncbi:MAG: lactate utilization protein [Syntrophobacterales bacterium]|jgi:L-lactate utilization protein LutB|nr:lactate utilization protein [Syntrophobacterales bacterium]
MDIHQITYREKLAHHLIKALTRRRLEASYAPTAAQARDEILAMIPAGATVSRGGSMSLVEMGLWEALGHKPGVEVLDPFEAGLPPEVAQERRRQSLLVDFFLTGSNAITMDGKLVNLDGLGNRVAGMCFGPKKVILVVGLNKVAPDLESAMARVKHHAAPINCIRLGRATPCAETGLCIDCKSPERICYLWSIIEGHMIENRIHVKLVGEDLGY